MSGKINIKLIHYLYQFIKSRTYFGVGVGDGQVEPLPHAVRRDGLVVQVVRLARTAIRDDGLKCFVL